MKITEEVKVAWHVPHSTFHLSPWSVVFGIKLIRCRSRATAIHYTTQSERATPPCKTGNGGELNKTAKTENQAPYCQIQNKQRYTLRRVVPPFQLETPLFLIVKNQKEIRGITHCRSSSVYSELVSLSLTLLTN